MEPDKLPQLRDEALRIAHMARENPAHDLCGGFISRDFEGDYPWSVRGLFAPGWEAPCFAEYMASEPVTIPLSRPAAQPPRRPQC